MSIGVEIEDFDKRYSTFKNVKEGEKVAKNFYRKGHKLANAQGFAAALGLSDRESMYVDLLVGEKLMKNYFDRAVPQVSRSVESLQDYLLDLNQKNWLRHIVKPYKRWREQYLLKYAQANEKYGLWKEELKESVFHPSQEARVILIEQAIHNILTEGFYNGHIESNTTDIFKLSKNDLQEWSGVWKEKLENKSSITPIKLTDQRKK